MPHAMQCKQRKEKKKENAPRARGPRRVLKQVGCWGGAPHLRTLVLAGLRTAETIQLPAASHYPTTTIIYFA